MNEYLKKYWKQVAAFAVVGLIVIPFLIHLAFKIPAPCNFLIAKWSAGDVLGFYGVLLGAAATVGGVFLTIGYTQSKYREDIRNQSLPYIALTVMEIDGRFSFWDVAEEAKKEEEKKNNHNSSFREYTLDEVFYVISKGKPVAYKHLTADQENCVRHFGTTIENTADGVEISISKRLVYMSLEIENVGRGAALEMRMGLNSSSIEKNQQKFLKPIAFKVGQKMIVHVYAENPDDSNVGEYDLILNYKDLFNNTYEQHFSVGIGKDQKYHMWLDGKDPKQELLS